MANSNTQLPKDIQEKINDFDTAVDFLDLGLPKQSFEAFSGLWAELKSLIFKHLPASTGDVEQRAKEYIEKEFPVDLSQCKTVREKDNAITMLGNWRMAAELAHIAGASSRQREIDELKDKLSKFRDINPNSEGGWE